MQPPSTRWAVLFFVERLDGLSRHL